MNLNLFISLAINGITMGMIYAMVAMGLILLIRAVGVLNFAQGALLMFGAYVSSWLIKDLGLPLAVMIPVAILIFILIGLIFMFSTYWPLRNATYPVAAIIATVGASLVLTEGAPIVFGFWPRTVPQLFGSSTGRALTVSLFGSRIQVQYLATIVIAAASMYIIHILFNKLYFGRMMQAAAQDKYASQVIGISIKMTTAVTYSLVVILVSTAGFLVGPIFLVSPSLSSLQLRAFAGTVIGGFGSIKGAIIGCLIVGLIEAFATVRFSVYKDAVVFIVLMIFLAVRPCGLIKSRIGDKA